jgi:hypothetical protein
MPYSQLYNKLIATETKTSVTRLRPRKLYRILSYQYTDGHTQNFRGAKGVLIFVLGKFHGKIYCLKITEIKPEKFFRWLKTIMFKNLKEEHFHNLKFLENMIPKSDRAGEKLYNSAVKGKQIVKGDPSPFRTYIQKNIKQILWVELKTAQLEKMYGIRHEIDNKHDNEEDKLVKKEVKDEETNNPPMTSKPMQSENSPNTK